MPAQTELRRDLEFERGLVAAATAGVVERSGRDLTELCASRAWDLAGEYVDDPMLINPNEPRIPGAIQELADCLNNVLFYWQQEGDDLSDGEQRELLEAIRGTVVVYDILRRHTV